MRFEKETGTRNQETGETGGQEKRKKIKEKSESVL